MGWVMIFSVIEDISRAWNKILNQFWRITLFVRHFFETALLTRASDVHIDSGKQTLMKTLAINLRTEKTLHISQWRSLTVHVIMLYML
jgi:type II secretory ATPase GspE/PulE/Tfp pilus assembly ATPase PilB-like protein